MSELNKLTQKLMEQGFTKENPPDGGFLPWHDFYGGWQYSNIQRTNMVIKAPCGIVGNVSTANVIDMGWQGIEWCLENDNALINCPYNKQCCEKRNPLFASGGDILSNYCQVHIIEEAFDYDSSIEKIREQNRKRENELFEELKRQRQGRVCRVMSQFNDKTGKWRIHYSPIQCIECAYCDVLQKQLTSKKGNVFYDLKMTTVNKGIGLLPDETVTTVIKGKRFYEKNRSMDICEMTAKCCKADIQYKEKMKYSTELFFAEYHNQPFAIEVMNIRAERRESRDLDSDINDIQNGIKVVHQSDLEAAKKERKHNSRVAAEERKAENLKKAVIKKGYENLSSLEKNRIGKAIDKGLIDVHKLEVEHKKPKAEQITMF